MQAVSRIYGRRIRGDVGPLNLDPQRRLPGRIIGPAVSLTGYLQDYEEATDIKHFTFGSRMELIGGRVFYYARVAPIPDWQTGAPDLAVLKVQRGVKNSLYQVVTGLPAPAVVAPIVAIPVAGATQVVITVAITDGFSSHGLVANGAIGADTLAEGHIVIFPGGGGAGVIPRGLNRTIIANTATLAGGGQMTVTLDRPLPIALAAGTTGAIMASEYAAVQTSDEYHAVVGVAHVAAAAGQYLWLQTWGSFWMSAQLTVGHAQVNPNNFQVVFRADGSLGLHETTEALAVDNTISFAQHAGYILNTLTGVFRGAPFVCLQITP